MTERVAKIYLDTSVFGGYYDLDFEEDTQTIDIRSPKEIIYNED